MKDYYEILGIEKNTSQDEIKRAFFRLVRKYSPEKNPEEYENIRKAYDVLSDRKLRAEYDAHLEYGDVINQHEVNANEAMENENYKLAIREYKKILLIEPTLENIKNRLGIALMYDEQVEDALKQFLELVNLYPENTTYTRNLAHAYWKNDNFIYAQKYLNKAYDLEPINIQVIEDLADLYIDYKKYSKAVLFLQKCIDNQNGDESLEYLCLFKLIKVYIFDNKNNEIDRTIDILRKHTDDNESRRFIGWEFGKLAYKMLDTNIYELAEKFAKEAIDMIPDNDDILSLYNECLQKNKIYTLYKKLSNDENIIEPLKGPIYYFLFGNRYEEKEFEKLVKQNLDVIESYLFCDGIAEVKNSIDLLKKEYYELYKFKEQLYNEIYGLANDISNVTDDKNYDLDSNDKTKKKWSFTENERILIIMCAAVVCCILISLKHQTVKNYNFNKEKSYVDSSDYQQSDDDSSEEKDSAYIMPDSNSRYLTIFELNSYSDSDLGYMRNEIFARHGYVFTNEEYKEYFENKSWYTPDSSFNGDAQDLNDYERENIKAIKSLEKSKKDEEDYLYKDYENVDTNNES